MNKILSKEQIEQATDRLRETKQNISEQVNKSVEGAQKLYIDASLEVAHKLNSYRQEKAYQATVKNIDQQHRDMQNPEGHTLNYIADTLNDIKNKDKQSPRQMLWNGLVTVTSPITGAFNLALKGTAGVAIITMGLNAHDSFNEDNRGISGIKDDIISYPQNHPEDMALINENMLASDSKCNTFLYSMHQKGKYDELHLHSPLRNGTIYDCERLTSRSQHSHNF